MPPRKNGQTAKNAGRVMPAFTKPSAKTVSAFQRAVNGVAGIEHRTMFGYPSVFLNGNMLASIFQDRILPASVIDDAPALRRWLERGRAYVATLPKKAKKKSK